MGTPILAALKACATLSLTVVTRPRPATSTTTTLSATPGVRIIVADYTSVEELTVAFNGADAVISAVNTMLVDQTPFIDAAVAAKVRRFIPSEFGADLSHPRTAGLPVFTAKARAREKLQVLADQGVIEWAAVANGMFLDWGESSLLIHIRLECRNRKKDGERYKGERTEGVSGWWWGAKVIGMKNEIGI